ncbi:MAG: hypothetical protein ACOX6P_02950 [Candidatus Merdivicinus sp.]|jgi:hypothetical protein
MKKKKQKISRQKMQQSQDYHQLPTPEYLTNPLTSYRIETVNGNQILDLPDQNVLRMREFDIENKK